MDKKIKKLKEENKILRETCEILVDDKLMRSIRLSLKQISQGKVIPFSQL